MCQFVPNEGACLLVIVVVIIKGERSTIYFGRTAKCASFLPRKQKREMPANCQMRPICALYCIINNLDLVLGSFRPSNIYLAPSFTPGPTLP
jgi:hypothetical protein